MRWHEIENNAYEAIKPKLKRNFEHWTGREPSVADLIVLQQLSNEVVQDTIHQVLEELKYR